jgi:hypothetical protein
MDVVSDAVNNKGFGHVEITDDPMWACNKSRFTSTYTLTSFLLYPHSFSTQYISFHVRALSPVFGFPLASSSTLWFPNTILYRNDGRILGPTSNEGFHKLLSSAHWFGYPSFLFFDHLVPFNNKGRGTPKIDILEAGLSTGWHGVGVVSRCSRMIICMGTLAQINDRFITPRWRVRMLISEFVPPPCNVCCVWYWLGSWSNGNGVHLLACRGCHWG